MNERAVAEITEFGRHYLPGEFLPFYVPREFMPQVDEQYLVQLIAESYAHDPGTKIVVSDPRELHAHQRIDHVRARHMDEGVRMKPIIVSSDAFVVDGNHRWWSHVKSGSTAVTQIVLPMAFNEAIDWLKALPYVYCIAPDTPIRN